jgi:hypothetical protein
MKKMVVIRHIIYQSGDMVNSIGIHGVNVGWRKHMPT